MSYKVLNVEGDKIIVDQVDPTIHKHLSWREFTENDACIRKQINAKAFKDMDLPEPVFPNVKPEVKESLDKIEMIREEAVIAYKEKYGRKPSSKMKTENIIAKLK